MRGWSFALGNWQPQAPWSPTNSAVLAFHGSNSIRLEHSVAGTRGPNAYVSKPYKLKTNTTYTVTIYAKADVGNTAANALHFGLRNTSDPAYGGQDSGALLGSVTVTTAWKRFTNTVVTTTNPIACTYFVEFFDHWETGNGDFPGQYMEVDAIQLEEGSATDYAPMSPLEVGPLIDRNTPGHVYITTNSIAVNMVGFNNSNVSQTVSIHYEVRDHWNAQKLSNSVDMTFGANASSTQSISLTLTNTGGFRFVSWITNLPSSICEYQFMRVPPPVSLANRTNSHMGGTLHEAPWYLGAAQRLGTHWSRDFSLENHGNWLFAEPTNGVWVIDTNAVGLLRQYDIEPLLQMVAKSGNPPQIPNYGTNSVDFWPDNSLLSNFTWGIVGYYSNYVKYYELFNEIAGTNQFTNAFLYARAGILAADPTSVIVGPADYYGPTVAGLLRLIGTNKLDIWSTHIYDGTDGSFFYSATNMTNAGKRGFMTEAGLRTDPSYRTIAFEDVFIGVNTPDSVGFTRDSRIRTLMDHGIWIGDIRDPIDVFFYYEQRASGGFDLPITFSQVDYDNTSRPFAAMQAIIAQQVENAVPRGRVSLDSRVNMFWWDRSGQAIVTIWQTNNFGDPLPLGGEPQQNSAAPLIKLKMLSSLAANQFTILDMMGNTQSYGSGYSFGMDAFWVLAANGVATNTLLNSLSIAADSDTVAPNIQFVTWPTTRPIESTNFTLRWTAVDDVSMDVRWNGYRTNNNPNNTNCIQYSWKLFPVDSSFSPWTNLYWAPYTALNTNTAYLFTLQSKDAAGNTTINNLAFGLEQTNSTPIILVTPPALTFSTAIPFPQSLTISVTNIGGGTLSGSASMNAPYSITSGNASYSLNANDGQTLTIKFTPTSVGTFNDALVFTGGGGASAPVTGFSTNLITHVRSGNSIRSVAGSIK